MVLESVIWSEVGQKEKSKYCILMLLCGIQRNGRDEPICEEETETQTQRRNVQTIRGSKEGVG